MKALFTVIISTLFLISCQPNNCNNGIQDGNETGIDCGGDCPTCSVTPPTLCSTPSTAPYFNLNLVGKWKQVYAFDIESQSEIQVTDEPVEFYCDIYNTSPDNTVYYKSKGVPQYPWGDSQWSYYNNIYDSTHEVTVDSILHVGSHWYKLIELNQTSLKLDWLELPQQNQSIMNSPAKMNIYFEKVQ